MCLFANRNKKSLLIILILFLLFFIPFQMAEKIYLHGARFFPKAKTQHGYLIQPPLSIDQLSLYEAHDQPFNQKKLRGKWLLLYVGPDQCDELCKKKPLPTSANTYCNRQRSNACSTYED